MKNLSFGLKSLLFVALPIAALSASFGAGCGSSDSGSDDGGDGTSAAGSSGSGGSNDGTSAGGSNDGGGAGGSNDGSGAGGSADCSGGDKTKGEALFTSKICTTCHLSDLSGSGIYPNLTPDPDASNIKGWTACDIVKVLTTGEKKNGEMVCSTMKMPYAMQDAGDAADLAAYILSVSPSSVKETMPTTGCGD